ncbi:hypothetical protein [Nonomuraea typhae]|uniref:hypothetical protein n=1 Tax=Nonomuraea typhae TaxID=2603600 RepID=UPI0012FC33BB|nr:hypothetical protein [Nonomuraea typhae]
MTPAERLPNPPRPDMVTCPNCGTKNEPDRTACRNCQNPMTSQVRIYCPCQKRLHTKHCLSALFGCDPRAVVRMAWLGRWPSIKSPVGDKGYRFTDAMVAEIVEMGEKRPEASAKPEVRQRRPEVVPTPKPRVGRDRLRPVGAASLVAPLVAKPGRRRR